MTSWEEFLVTHKRFKPENSQKEIELLKRRYNSMVQWEEDQNYLFPVSVPFYEALGVPHYGKEIENYFQLQPADQDEIRIMVIPAFEPEFQIIIHAKAIVVNTANESLWQKLSDKKSNGISIITTRFEVKNPIKIFKATELLMVNAKLPEQKGFILDGIKYFFFRKNKPNSICTCHSPRIESTVGIYLQELYSNLNLKYQE